jgi:hypothetical protein
MNDIHMELGATSGTAVTLNDTDVRALAERNSGSISLFHFYGKSAATWTPITGAFANAAINGGGTTYYSSVMKGWSTEYFVYGSPVETVVSLSDSTNRQIKTIYGTYYTNTGLYAVYMSMFGAGNNSGFNSINILKQDSGQSVSLNRVDASFSSQSNSHFWSWTNLNLGFHPFTDDGSFTVIGFF